MATDLAKLEVTAVDSATATLTRVKGAAEDLAKSADSIKSAWGGGLFDGFTKGPALAAVGAIGALTAGVVGLGTYFVGLARDVASAQASLKSLSEVTGASVEWLSSIRGVAKLAGTDLDAVGGGITKLAKTIETGGGEAERALKAIGLNLKDLQGLRTDEQFDRVAKALGNYADGAGKTAAAQLLLGKSGAQLLPFMKDYVETGDLVVKTTRAQAFEADELEKNIMRLRMAKEAWKKTVGSELVPVLSDVVTAMVRMQTEAGGLNAEAKKLAQDGSIRRWAEEAVDGLAALIDHGRVIAQTFKVIGLAAVAVGADITYMVTNAIAGANGFQGVWQEIAQGAKRAAQGARDNFNGAFDSLLTFNATKVQDAVTKAREIGNLVRRAASGEFDDARDRIASAKPIIRGLDEKSVAAAKDNINQLAKALADLYNKLDNKDVALVKEVELLTKGLQVGAIGIATYADRMALAIKQSKTYKEAIDDLVRYEKAYNDAIDAELAAELKRQDVKNDAIRSLREEIEQIQQETRFLGLSNEERIISTALLKAQKAGIDTTTEAWAQMAAQLRQAVYDKSAQETTLKNLEDTRRASEQIWKGIGDDVSNWIMSGFKNTRDLLKRMFETLVLRPLIQPIAGDITGMLSGLLGGGGGAGGGILSGLLGGGGGLLGGLFGGFSGSATGAFQNVLGSLFGTGGGIIEGLGSTIAGVSGGISGLLGGSIFSGLGQILGALGPIGMVAGTLAAIAKHFDGANGTGLKFGRDGKGLYGDSPGSAANIFSNRLGDFAYEGDDANANNLKNLAPFVARFNALANVVAGQLAGTLGDSALQAVRDKIGKIRKEDWFKYDGDPAVALQKAVSDLLKDVFGTAYADLDPQLAAIVQGFTGTGDELMAFLEQVITIQAAIADAKAAAGDFAKAINGDVQNALDAASNNVLAAWRAQVNGLDKLLAIAPDSTDALGQLVSGMAGFRSAAVQMELQIRQVKAAMDGMFGDAIRSIELSLLDAQGQYDYLQRDAEALAAQARLSNDPLAIQNYLQRILGDVSQAQGLLSPEQRALLGPEQIERLRALQAELQARMDSISAVNTTTAANANQQLIGKMQELLDAQIANQQKQDDAANKQVDAGDKQLDAANKPLTLNINITDRTVTAAVGDVGG